MTQLQLPKQYPELRGVSFRIPNRSYIEKGWDLKAVKQNFSLVENYSNQFD